MARASKLLDRMRRTRQGWSQSDFCGVLEYYGYQLVRQANHGAIYRHPDLASHPELAVRMSAAQVMIPKGTKLKGYVADQVITSVDVLLNYREEQEEIQRGECS